MATSGYKDVAATYTTSGNVGDTLRFSWSLNGKQSIENNETPIKWSLLLIAGSAGYISSSASKKWAVTIDGTPYSGTTTVGIANGATKTLASGTHTIKHDSDGSKKFSVSFSQVFNITFNSYVGTVSGAASFTLDTIPRATTPTLSPTTVVMGEKLTITLPRATDSFTHTLQHDFYVGSWTTFATGVGTETIFETPESWASGIPNATSGSGRIRCLTYSGSTLIGEKIVNFTATVPTSMIPTVDSIAVSEGSEGLAAKFGAFIQSKSKLRVVSAGSGIQGSTISSYKVEILGVSYSGADITTDYILKSGKIDVKTTVTDSRGRKGSKTVNVTLLEYYTPTITDFSAFRADANGNASNKGTSLKCLLDFKIAPCGNKNDKSYTIQYKKTTASTYTVLKTDSGYYTLDSSYLKTEILAIESAYDVQIVLKDYFSEATYTLRVGSKIVPIAVYPNGKGMGIFGYPTKEAFQVFGLTELFDSLILAHTNGKGGNIKVFNSDETEYMLINSAQQSIDKYGSDGSVTRLVIKEGKAILQYFSDSSTYVGSVTLGEIKH